MTIDQVHEQNSCTIKLLLSLNFMHLSDDGWYLVVDPGFLKGGDIK